MAIARALINDPALILADEPTANLDSKIGHEIMRLLRRIAKEQGRSVVIVSHDQRIRDIADRVLWLEDGAFKDIVTMATDPVCGMAVERERAVSADARRRELLVLHPRMPRRVPRDFPVARGVTERRLHRPAQRKRSGNSQIRLIWL